MNADAHENGAQQIEPAVDVPADQELLGRTPLKLHLLGVPCVRRRGEIGVGGVGRAAAVGQRETWLRRSSVSSFGGCGVRFRVGVGTTPSVG